MLLDSRTRLLTADEGLVLDVEGERLPLPDGAVAAVMRRYGKPLEESAALNIEERLDLGEGTTLERFRFLRRYDVIARDYVVYRAPGQDPVSEMATTLAGALLHLARL